MRKSLEDALANVRGMASDCTSHGVAPMEWIIETVEALEEKAERENPKPLTIEELEQMRGEPVWLTGYGWRICHGVYHFSNGLEMSVGVGCTIHLDNYGKLFVAYRHKPRKESQ